MKKIVFPILCFLLVMTNQLEAQTFCLRLMEVSNDGTNLIVRVEMQGSADFNLGSSNLQFSYNTAALENPVLETTPLGPPFYQIPTVTTPELGEVSLNIELGFVNFGSAIASGNDWTELGQINFTILDENNLGEMIWTYNGGTTQTVVFLDDEATQIFVSNIACLQGLDFANPFPVELLHFTARQKASTAILEWQTVTETNNKGFELLRSTDTRIWTPLTWLDGQGTTNESQNYSWVDMAPQFGTNYYRLRQLDFDGTEMYSNIQAVNFTSSMPILVFPNPTKETFQLQVPETFKTGQVKMYNEQGQLVLESTTIQVYFSVANLPSGIYLLVVEDGQQRYTEQLTVE